MSFNDLIFLVVLIGALSIMSSCGYVDEVEASHYQPTEITCYWIGYYERCNNSEVTFYRDYNGAIIEVK